MTAKKNGHVVNISSIGVLTNAPRFSAYVALIPVFNIDNLPSGLANAFDKQ